jgi:ribosome-associated translation inhibitor RaiA
VSVDQPLSSGNTYSFERIDWRRLAQAAIITTVSRYMKHLMWGWGVDPLVIPNGLAAEALVPPERHAVEAFRAHVTLVKHREWRRNRYEARVELTLAARNLQAVQVAKTPYDAMVAALKSVERKLRASRALEDAAATPHHSNIVSEHMAQA